jgi:hypothetical protein
MTNKYEVRYTAENTLTIWANSAAEADLVAQSQPNYYATLQIDDLGPFMYTQGQTVYWFDKEADLILKGTVTDINFIDEDTIKLFVRFDGDTISKMFMYPDDTEFLYDNLDDLINYLGRNLPSPPPSVLPTAPVGLSATNITTTTFTLNWLSVAEATGYNVYQDGTILIGNVTDLFTVLSGLTPSATHNMTVTALNAIGESLPSAILAVDTLPSVPAIPNGLVASNLTDVSFDMDWNASPTADSYNVYLNGALLTNVVTNSASISGLLASTSYTIEISALNTGGESLKSAVLPVTTYPAIPAAPTLLNATNITTSGFDLDWVFSAGASTYNVYQDTVSTVTGLTITTTPITGLLAGTNYSMEATALNITGESAFSTPLNVLTICDPPLNLVGSSVSDVSFDVSWDASTGADSYNVYLDTVQIQVGVLTLNTTIPGLTAGTTYSVTIRAVNATGESVDSVPLVQETIPSAPVNLADSLIGATQFDLSWDPVVGADSYNIYQDTLLVQSGVLSTTTTVTGLTTATAYSMKVSAVNTGGESVQSAGHVVTTI